MVNKREYAKDILLLLLVCKLLLEMKAPLVVLDVVLSDQALASKWTN